MFFIWYHIFHFPFNFSYENMFPDGTVFFDTNGTTASGTMIRMHKKFHGCSEFFLNDISKTVYFQMGFTHIQVPGYGHMAIYMQGISEFNHPQVMDINPVG